eukprot:4697575-Pyramimonas_sp.AAC.1
MRSRRARRQQLLPGGPTAREDPPAQAAAEGGPTCTPKLPTARAASCDSCSRARTGAERSGRGGTWSE